MSEKKILDHIRNLREELGLSQAALADELGIGRTSYVNFEKGKTRIFCKTLTKFARYCGLSETDIINGRRRKNEMLRDNSGAAEMRKALIEDYEERLAREKEKYEAALKVIEAHEITIRTLNETKDFLLTQLHKND